MTTGMIVFAMFVSMMAGVLLAVLVDTFYVRRLHQAMQSDKNQVEESLRRRTIQAGRFEAKVKQLNQQLSAYKRELEEEEKETLRLDELRVALETKLETAVAETESLQAKHKQQDTEIDTLRDEKTELAHQLTVAHVEMKNLEEDVAESHQKLITLDQLEAENQKLTATLAIVQKERDERSAKVEALLKQIDETEKLRNSLKETEEKLETSNAQLGNIQTALGRAKSQIKHTGKSQLQLIRGIGPATDRKLKAAGIVTVADLAEETPERVREILNLKPTSRMKPEAWITEAQQLAPTFSEETV